MSDNLTTAPLNVVGGGQDQTLQKEPPRKSSSLIGRMSKVGHLCRCVHNSRTHLVDQYGKYRGPD